MTVMTGLLRCPAPSCTSEVTSRVCSQLLAGTQELQKLQEVIKISIPRACTFLHTSHFSPWPFESRLPKHFVFKFCSFHFSSRTIWACKFDSLAAFSRQTAMVCLLFLLAWQCILILLVLAVLLVFLISDFSFTLDKRLKSGKRWRT